MSQSNFAEANGIRIHYHRSGGDKPQVLLLHGLTHSGACWLQVIDALKDEYDCIAPDARGHGLTDTPDTGYSSYHHAADAAALIQALKLNRPAVIGHSMGGAVAALLASQHPDLVRAAIFEDPGWFADDRFSTPEKRGKARKDFIADLQLKKSRSHTNRIADQRLISPRWSDTVLEPWACAKAQLHEEALKWLLEVQIDWREVLKHIQCPSLLITGDEANIIISPDQAREAQSLNAGLQVAHITGAGHCIRYDEFTAFTAVVRRFLTQYV